MWRGNHEILEIYEVLPSLRDFLECFGREPTVETGGYCQMPLRGRGPAVADRRFRLRSEATARCHRIGCATLCRLRPLGKWEGLPQKQTKGTKWGLNAEMPGRRPALRNVKRYCNAW
jgi:hypothetical protein